MIWGTLLRKAMQVVICMITRDLQPQCCSLFKGLFDYMSGLKPIRLLNSTHHQSEFYADISLNIQVFLPRYPHLVMFAFEIPHSVKLALLRLRP
jgi:hypothetical protein